MKKIIMLQLLSVFSLAAAAQSEKFEVKGNIKGETAKLNGLQIPTNAGTGKLTMLWLSSNNNLG